MSSRSPKKAISQRWSEELINKVKSIADSIGISSTDLTIEALETLIEILTIDEFRLMNSEVRKKLILKRILKPENSEPNQINQRKRRTHPPGIVMDTITNYLEKNPDTKLATTTISDQLSIPLSTVRAYVRELSSKNKNITLISGRPNFVLYKSR